MADSSRLGGVSAGTHLRRLGVTKGGQLGRMLLEAASPLGIDPAVLDPDPAAPCRTLTSRFVVGDPLDPEALYAFGRELEVLTVEWEHVDVGALQRLEHEGVLVRPGPEVLRVIQDKGLQKQFLRDLGAPTADFVLVEGRDQIRGRQDLLPGIQKTRRAGYDGKGVKRLDAASDLETAIDAPSVLEARVDIERELSVLVARRPSGASVSYPVVELWADPRQNLLELLVAPARVSEAIAREAEAIATRIAEALGVVGILAVEMFLDRSGRLLVNELAPRPHNSGHHTIEANVTSQFENHLRAVLDLPLGSTATRAPAAMVNLLGEPGHEGPARWVGVEKALLLPDVHLHIYGKARTAPYRKMGHATVLDPDPERARERALKVREAIKVVSAT